MLAKPTKNQHEYAATLICDNQCTQAWGKSLRPTLQIDGRTFWIADGQEPAPRNPGTVECGHTKPGGDDRYKLNKWCANECERSRLVPSGERFSLSNFEFPLKVSE